ncbi:MAG: BLUF domain-containing protein [Halobacteriovoraceae bacterium]|nr:BLUF domain-containing protein [Halobacteriovoraceae bacterium]
MSQVFQLLYSSNSSENFDVSVDVDGILNASKMFNEENDITGVLIYKGGVFLQLLEGDEGKVRTLFDKISSDSRHENLEVVYQGKVEERIFPHWTMAYRKTDLYSLDVQEKIEEFLYDLNDGEGIVSREDVLTFLKLVKFSF